MSAQNHQPKAELIVTELRNLSSDLTVPSEAQSIDILTCEIGNVPKVVEIKKGALHNDLT